MFLIYINDLVNAVNSGTQLLFADDANHFISGNDYNALIKQVNDDLKLITAWFRANNLSVNVIKTEAILFSRRPIYFPLPPILLNDNPIPICYSVKFLGVIIDMRLNWKNHIHRIQSKLSCVCGTLDSIRMSITISVAKLFYYS